jgi:hypothetical protein
MLHDGGIDVLQTFLVKSSFPEPAGQIQSNFVHVKSLSLGDDNSSLLK